MSVYKSATYFAKEKHGDQKRKYSGKPYIVHPVAVSQLVDYALTKEHVHHQVVDAVKAAAVMHDVLEDTDCTVDEMRKRFGDFITDLVLEVTDVSQPRDGNRARRKEIDRLHIAKGSHFGKTIKLADLIDNTSDIMSHDEDFARTYVKEKLLLLEVLKDGSPTLYKMAEEHAIKAKVYLDI